MDAAQVSKDRGPDWFYPVHDAKIQAQDSRPKTSAQIHDFDAHETHEKIHPAATHREIQEAEINAEIFDQGN